MKDGRRLRNVQAGNSKMAIGASDCYAFSRAMRNLVVVIVAYYILMVFCSFAVHVKLSATVCRRTYQAILNK